MSEGPRVVAQTDDFTVIDDLLDAAGCDGAWNYFQLQPMNRVDNLGLRGQWLIEDSAVLRGPTAGWGQKWDAEYPTGTPLDDVMKALIGCSEQFAATVGKQGADWKAFSATPVIYAAGQGRHWHRTAANERGSFIYYVHREWNVEWGGELYLSDARDIPAEYGEHLHRLRALEGLREPPGWQSHLDNEDTNQLLMAGGLGCFVMPKPNRLVVIRGGVPNAIAKIRTSAGRHVQAAVDGIFKNAAAPAVAGAPIAE